jgi:crotonobetainyl-CoA:carnitine CoA-transferase CaiB-like acyl-CoA transferase
MASDNIFSGLKVVDFASFIAGPSAAVILSDFGADVIKVEPPSGDLWRHGHQIPPQPQAKDAYPWHLANRNKRGITLDLKSPSASQVLEKLVKWADVLIVNTPHPARKKLKLEYDDVVRWNPRLIYADVTGFGEKGPDAGLPGFDITSYWARSGLLSMTRDAGAPPTWPVAGSGDNATAVGLYSAIVTALYRRERTGKGANVTTSLLAEGVWSASVSIQAALCEAKFSPPHDRKNPANAALNVYQASDGTWFVLIITPDKLAPVAKAIGRADLLTDPRFSDPAKLIANMSQLTEILDELPRIGKPRVCQDIRAADSFRHGRQLVRRDNENEPGAIGGPVYVQSRIRGILAIVRSKKLRLAQRRLDRDACRPDALGEQRGRDIRPLAGVFTTVERGDDRGIQPDGGGIVAAAGHRPGWRRADVARHRQQTTAGPV